MQQSMSLKYKPSSESSSVQCSEFLAGDRVLFGEKSTLKCPVWGFGLRASGFGLKV